MSRYATLVPLRWADLDAFRHVNHARAVTLLEQARVELVFHQGADQGAGDWSEGLLVASLEVEYRVQIPYRGQSLRVEMWVDQVRAAQFMIHYEMRVGPEQADPVAVTASTRMVPFDLTGGHPRRLTGDERAFLARWVDTPDPATRAANGPRVDGSTRDGSARVAGGPAR